MNRRKFIFTGLVALATTSLDSSPVKGQESVDRSRLKKQFEDLAKLYNELLKKCDFVSSELSPEQVVRDNSTMDKVDALLDPFRSVARTGDVNKSKPNTEDDTLKYTPDNLPEKYFDVMNELVNRTEQMLRFMDSVQNKKSERYTALMRELAAIINSEYVPYCAYS